MNKILTSALAATALAVVAVPLAATSASAAPVANPSIVAVTYGGEFTQPDYYGASIGTSEAPVFSVATGSATSGTVSVTHQNGKALCSTAVTSYGTAQCRVGAPLKAGQYQVRVVVKDAHGTVTSSPMDLGVYSDGPAPASRSVAPVAKKTVAAPTQWKGGSGWNYRGSGYNLGLNTAGNSTIKVVDQNGTVTTKTEGGELTVINVPGSLVKKNVYTVTQTVNGVESAPLTVQVGR